MASREEVEEFIAHALSPKNYDPVKAREYYLKTRKLKGRQPGVIKPTSSKPSSTPLAKASKKRIKKVAAPSKAMQANAALRVGALTKKLAKLQDLLSKLIQKAKNSESKSKDKKSSSEKSTSGSSRKESSDLTSSQKSEKAEKARDDYEKVDKPSSAKAGDSESLKADTDAQIKKVRAQIAKIKADIKVATSKGRATSNTKKK